ncbi:MAG: TolC family protein [Muribaculaceae bacterium]|nr:TolC family protein [Muribaculaceae bacterium]
MKHLVLTFFTLLFFATNVDAQLTLERCQQLAQENYPTIKKYGLIEKSLEIELSDINKSWLPSITAYGQGTIQNVVPAFPQALEDVLAQMGREVRGIGKFQYKIGVDVSQTIWDGGASKTQREIVRSQEAVQQSSLEVEMYVLRQKVDNIYFAILLIGEQIKQSNQTLDLLNANLDLLRSMLRNGTAMRSDVDMVQAQALTLKQSITQAESTVKSYRTLLNIYLGEDVSAQELVLPSADLPATLTSDRPELKLFDNRQNALETSQLMTNVSIMPKIGFFAQAYYGYPGFDYFKSMMNRNLSFNIMAGVRMLWNIDSFYTKKNKLAKTVLEVDNINIERETFLFNSRLQTESQLENLEGLRNVMQDDARIVELRGNVRKAAESQLRNGIIDATALLSKITDENAAKLTAKFHEIQYIQEIYKIKNTLNR